MINPRLVMILASAGSGKTFALTNRFIALLAAGAPPERIVALTFTRKAAGEFFDTILGKLAAAAASESAAGELGRAIGRSELRAADFLRHLRALTECLHRLRLGTLDSFFAQVARTFPLELGLTGAFEVLEEHAARLARREVMSVLFARSGGALSPEQREFLEAFKRATFGTEDKQLGRRLDEFLERGYDLYRETPDADRWGNERRVWPEGQMWLQQANPTPALAALRRWLDQAEIEDKQRVRWEKFLAAAASWAPGAVLPDELEFVLTKALVHWSELCGGGAELEFDRQPQPLDATACRALSDLVRHVAGGELRRRLASTQGLHAVLRSYDRLYDAMVRRMGKLSFADVQRLLQPEGGARALSSVEREGNRLAVDYRLDGSIDHWLLDEFQDTSRGQWSILRNLIDEVVQDAEARRSFFCVGDVKQSIYGWREGDPDLMGDIRRHYNGDAEGPIVTESLDASWRSGPEVIAMVNAVFGNAAVISRLFPGAAAEKWNRAWRDHSSARQDRAGQATLLHAGDADERLARTLEVIRQVDPLRRGLSCAILVRRNHEAAQLVDYLRREGGVPAVAESDLNVCTDNPIGAALLALVHAAAHPGDCLAWEHVRMSPVADALEREGLASIAAASRRLLAQIQEQGFERAMEYWVRRIPRGGEFGQLRARQFVEAAALYDRTGKRDLDEFGHFMRRHVIRDAEAAAVVRVMTIHKAKGLGFDVVVLPELQGKRLNSAREDLAVHRGHHRDVEWILDLPPAWLARADETLSRHLAGAQDDACYEALSLLYVGMTRAKRALYVITEPVAPRSASYNFPMLLAETLGRSVRNVSVGSREFAGVWSMGHPDWYRTEAPTMPSQDPAPLQPIPASAVPRRVRRLPSSARANPIHAGRIPLSAQSSARARGQEVHRLLAQVEWVNDAREIDRFEQAWSQSAVLPEARRHALNCLRAPDLTEVWRRPDGRSAEVWRERAFEALVDGAWVSGVFDRVVIVRDAQGVVQKVWVYDFKTDVLVSPGEGAVGRHREQLRLYRRVAAILLALSEESVTAAVVFTESGRSEPVS